jgi:NO-binding membrane sensor protein with MHYT domain
LDAALIFPGAVMIGTYNYGLVALSVLVSVLSAYAALDLAGRVTSAHGRARYLWLSGGAATMGIGIWSMHYLGMLAFHLPVPIEHDWHTVALSFLAAIFASLIALLVVSQKTMGVVQTLLGSVFMGGAIASMHYIGMSAMRLPAVAHYSVAQVLLSIFLAVVISLVALVLTFQFRSDTILWSWRKAGSALVLGSAITVMHYTSMAATRFTSSTLSSADLSHALSISSVGTGGIIIVTLMVLGLTLLTTSVERRFSTQALDLAASE